MSANSELGRVRVTVGFQSPSLGSLNVVLDADAPGGESRGRSEAVVMMGHEARAVARLLHEAAAMVRGHLELQAPGALDEEQGAPADVVGQAPGEDDGALGDDAIRLVAQDRGETVTFQHWIVEVYTSEASREACRSTLRLLDEHGVAYTEIDLAKASIFQTMAPMSQGITAQPAVLLRDSNSNRVVHAWGGFRPDLIIQHFGRARGQRGPKGAA